MNGQQIAVIDLGTNTFHVLVVRVGDGTFDYVYRERIFVNLAEEGITRIGQDAWERAMEALIHYNAILKPLGVKHVIAIGTAALRTASNADEFIRAVHKQTGIQVEVISGEREAGLIATGVWEAIPPLDVPGLIMDIGGGSVEFILTDRGTTSFSASYPAGVAVLYESFHKSEPITADQLNALDHHLETVFSDLISALKTHPDAVLIGASGTFEVVDKVLHPTEDDLPYSTFSHLAFDKIYREVVSLDLAQRLSHPDIPVSRAQYIVVAVHLISFVMRYLSGPDAYISKYAMKEGIAVNWNRGFED